MIGKGITEVSRFDNKSGMPPHLHDVHRDGPLPDILGIQLGDRTEATGKTYCKQYFGSQDLIKRRKNGKRLPLYLYSRKKAAAKLP